MAVIAFIPVRGGSKSIPLKNIKPLCGKPLVYWNLHELEKTEAVDKIYVATDSDVIESLVASFNFSKVSIYRRNAQNASDTASTESVMLEFLEQAGGSIHPDNLFLLVQATSPLTSRVHFSEAIYQLAQAGGDSLLSCVRTKRFFWTEERTPLNYDFRNRPRRQDFQGLLVENGAFYINKVVNVLNDRCRLSGTVSIYEMPEYTQIEIDEEDDWVVAESLMRRHFHTLQDTGVRKIKLFATDVDGVLTDAGMYYSENGDELKKFNTRDGKGLELLRDAGIKTAIITTEITSLVERRAKKLKIDYLYQGKTCGGKLNSIIEICAKEGFRLEEVAYIGDDINCKDALENVGWAACPSDASLTIKALSGIHILTSKGGHGVVREFAEEILKDY